MKTRSKIVFLLIPLFIMSLYSCHEKQSFPIEPIIKFIDFKVFSTDSAEFIFSFTDGDGDIGLESSDTLPPFNIGSPYYYNFYMDYYELQNDSFIKVEPVIPFYYRIPPLTPQGTVKALEGEIKVQLSHYFDPTSPYDTILFEAFIYDRDLNRSNVIKSYPILKKR